VTATETQQQQQRAVVVNGFAEHRLLLLDFMEQQREQNERLSREMRELRGEFASRLTKLETDFTTRMTRLETQRSVAVAAIGLISGVLGIALGAGLKKMLGLG
jgi:hypothetical protein